MENILVSACLLGVGCRYDGQAKEHPEIEKLKEKYNLIPVCPEELGGLPTPRTPSEINGDRVLMKDGTDVTESFLRGALKSVDIARKYDCRKAVLKARSPSCSPCGIYDGSFTHTLKDGLGVTANCLKNIGVKIYSEDDVEKI